MLSSERQYVAVLKGVEETYLPLLELSDTPASIRGKADVLFPNWTGLSTFHSQNLLPAMEGALVQSLLQQDCFSKYVSVRYLWDTGTTQEFLKQMMMYIIWC